ncbi:MAG TPA: DUF362 domain-containing protein [Terriglobia bacterium]|nr:DUF362 domain-containing protein [Terriglobia bacterium]
MDRRVFLKTAVGMGLGFNAKPGLGLLGPDGAAPAYLGLHPFIEAHPEAVFIRQTHVSTKNDSEAKRREAFELARRIFPRRDSPGQSPSVKFAIKPNLTAVEGRGLDFAIITDPNVVEGLIDGLRQAGVSAGNIYARDALNVDQPGIGYQEMARRSGVHYSDNDCRSPMLRECPEGVVFRRTKYLGPFSYPDTHLINVAKLKTHGMGLTLCVKNLQGANILPYIQFCGGLQKAIAKDFQPDAQSHVDDLQEKHQQAGIPRWDTAKAGWMEMWIQRTIDSYSLLRSSILLNVIDGVYAQNGNGFTEGPGPSGEPDVFMTNVLVFGKDAFRVDIIGHWLGGHEPGNFGLFHIGKERGVSTALNPRNIPLYRWEDAGPQLIALDKLTRTPLATPYLGKEGEPLYHLCNEPFAYPSETQAACLGGGKSPGLRVLGQTLPGNGGASLTLEFNLPRDTHARVEMCNALGERVGVLAEGLICRGVHAVDWMTQQRPSGLYTCRLWAEGVSNTTPIFLPNRG